MVNVSETSEHENRIRVSDEFDFVATRTFDDKYRVSLGSDVIRLLNKLFTFASFDIYVNSEGYVLLQPMHRIPANEQWIWKDSKIKASFKRALDDARQGRTTRVSNLNEFLKSL